MIESDLSFSQENNLKFKELEDFLDLCELELEGEDVLPYSFVARKIATNEIVGYVGACSTYGTACFIPVFAVHPEHKNTGVADALIYLAMSNLKAMGFKYFDATVEQDNEAAKAVYDRYQIPLQPVYALDGNIQDILTVATKALEE